MQTQPIGPSGSTVLPAGAAEALGGAPVPMPAIPGLEVPAAPAAPFLTGVATFDPEPEDVTARREKVAKARAILRAAMENVAAAHEAITPILNDLADEKALCKNAERFDVDAARDLIGDMFKPVRALKHAKPAAPAPQPAAKP